MASKYSSIKIEILAALKEARIPDETKVGKIVFNIVGDASEAILKGVDRMFIKRDKRLDRLKAGQKKLGAGQKNTDRSLVKLEVGQANLKDQIQGLKADLSDTPSRAQFEKLKGRVNKHHSLN